MYAAPVLPGADVRPAAPLPLLHLPPLDCPQQAGVHAAASWGYRWVELWSKEQEKAYFYDQVSPTDATQWLNARFAVDQSRLTTLARQASVPGQPSTDQHGKPGSSSAVMHPAGCRLPPAACRGRAGARAPVKTLVKPSLHGPPCPQVTHSTTWERPVDLAWIRLPVRGEEPAAAAGGGPQAPQAGTGGGEGTGAGGDASGGSASDRASGGSSGSEAGGSGAAAAEQRGGGHAGGAAAEAGGEGPPLQEPAADSAA